MTREKIKKELLEIIRDFFSWTYSGDVDDSTDFDVLQLNSVDLVDLALVLEDRYLIAISEEELDECTSFGKLVDLVFDKVSKY